MTFLESMRRQREIGEEILQQSVIPADRPATGAGDRVALRSVPAGRIVLGMHWRCSCPDSVRWRGT